MRLRLRQDEVVPEPGGAERPGQRGGRPRSAGGKGFGRIPGDDVRHKSVRGKGEDRACGLEPDPGTFVQQKIEPLAGPGQFVVQVQLQAAGPPGSKRRRGAQAQMQSGRIGTSVFQQADSRGDRHNALLPGDGVGAGDAGNGGALQGTSCGQCLHALDLGQGLELDEGLRGRGPEQFRGRDVQKGLDDLGKILIQALVDEPAQEGRAFQQALDIGIRAPGGQQGRYGRMLPCVFGTKFAQVFQFYGVIVLHEFPGLWAWGLLPCFCLPAVIRTGSGRDPAGSGRDPAEVRDQGPVAGCGLPG